MMSERRRSSSRIRGDSATELLSPLPRWPKLLPHHRHCSDADAGFEIIDIFSGKASVGCSPPSFYGSPPSRAGNPLIHDVQFIQPRSSVQMACSQQQSVREPSARVSKPSVRVEGFVPSGRVADSRSVSTMA